jgi:light-regulated signal transduction histidine kinase (bacteriophytochrome)
MAGKLEQIEYYENTILTQSGENRLIAWHNVLLRDDAGNITGSLSSGEDITERKLAEEQVKSLNQDLQKRAAELETVNKELDAFAYSISHDLRAPLRHIEGFLQLLKQNISASLNEQSEHYMTTILRVSNRMGRMIDDLLTFSRMERQALSKADIDLEKLIHEIIDDFKFETNDRTIKWHIGDLPVVWADRTLISSVLTNLISNAIKFTKTRSIAEIEIGGDNQQGESIIFVRDNGVGFNMTYIDKLFGAFQRLHNTREFEGSGIGLANVYRIIKRHGGRTWAEGKLDESATFYFSLPSSGTGAD